MHVIATRNSRREGPDYVEYVGLADEHRTLAARADVVVNSTLLTPETRGMFDAQFFAAMKDGAFFSNVIITPHIVTSSDCRSDRTLTLVAENVRRYVRGDAVCPSSIAPPVTEARRPSRVCRRATARPSR
jgi:phosphoglycerate dehydrogenase-like enzyme